MLAEAQLHNITTKTERRLRSLVVESMLAANSTPRSSRWEALIDRICWRTGHSARINVKTFVSSTSMI